MHEQDTGRPQGDRDAQRDDDRPPLQRDHDTGGAQPLQQHDAAASPRSAEPAVDDRDAHEPGWTDGPSPSDATEGEDGQAPGRTRGEPTSRTADVAKNR